MLGLLLRGLLLLLTSWNGSSITGGVLIRYRKGVVQYMFSLSVGLKESNKVNCLYWWKLWNWLSVFLVDLRSFLIGSRTYMTIWLSRMRWLRNFRLIIKVRTIINDMMTITTISLVFYIHAGVEQLIFIIWKVCFIDLSTTICFFFVSTVSFRMRGIFVFGIFKETILSFRTSSFANIFFLFLYFYLYLCCDFDFHLFFHMFLF